MIRQRIPLQALRGEKHFRWRGGDVSRLEGLADAVIALAMTLLIVSLEVPASFADLMASFRQLPVFAICFALLVMVWYYHFQFHRRFGLESGYILVLNAVLLFLILFYVYPLKFLFTELVEGVLYGNWRGLEDGRTLMLLYSGGVVGIFGVFLLMNLHAYRHREALELTAAEMAMTRSVLREHGIHVAIGSGSMVLALAGQPPLAGLIYFLVGPAQFLNGWLSGRAVEKMATDGLRGRGSD